MNPAFPSSWRARDPGHARLLRRAVGAAARRVRGRLHGRLRRRRGAPRGAGLVSYAEMLGQETDIRIAVSNPVIGDGDSGHALNVQRAAAPGPASPAS